LIRFPKQFFDERLPCSGCLVDTRHRRDMLFRERYPLFYIGSGLM
jgi:hypothetical protein